MVKSNYTDNQILIIRRIRSLNARRAATLLAALVVLLATLHVLILQTSALTEDEAERMGGIDLATVEQAEDNDAGDDQKDQQKEDQEDKASAGSEEKAAKDQGAPEGKDEEAKEDQKVETVACEGDGFTMSLENGVFPEKAALSVTEIEEKDKSYKEYYNAALKAVRKDAKKEKDDADIQALDFARVFDMSMDVKGKAIYPDQTMDAILTLDKGQKVEDEDSVRVVRFERKEDTGELTGKVMDPDDLILNMSKKGKLKEAVFEMDGVASYALVGATVFTEQVMTSDGKTYKVTVTAPAEAGIPQDAKLVVSEITRKSEDYQKYSDQTAEALDVKAEDLEYTKFLDITIERDGQEIQPKSDVDVEIQLLDKNSEDALQVVHFGQKTEVLKAKTEGDTVRFQTGGFSAYAIVAGPEAVPIGWNKLSLEELKTLAKNGQPVYIGHVDGYYLTDKITQINGTRTGITKTKPKAESPGQNAVEYYFEIVDENANQFKVYCNSEGSRKYVVQSSNSLNLTTSESEATVFTVEQFENTTNTYRLGGDDGFYWNMQSGAGGASFAAYNKATDANAKLYFWRYAEPERDPYGLDGQSFAILNWNGGGPVGKAMKASSSLEGYMDAMPQAVMTKKTGNKESKLFVPYDGGDDSMWTFHWIAQDQFYLSSGVDGEEKYLKITAQGLYLVDTAEEAGQIQVVPGTGAHKGEICLKAGNATLTYSGDAQKGFSVGGQAGSEWVRLAEKSELTKDYFKTYSASKVSVSNKDVTNGSKLIVYTRNWNEEEKQYEFYAIDHDGTLVPCFESGDSIEWVGGQFNTMLWDFVEYYDWGTTNPNFYYELYNEYSEKYIAPQLTGGQILSDNTIGINLNGRRDGKYYTSILAWDDPQYAYAGLKVQDGRIVSCPKSQAMDFYFAVMEEVPIDDEIHTVPTVDHQKYGITMKMVDIETRKEMSDFLGNNEGGIGTMLQQGLLSTKLGEDGYPVAVKGSGESLGNLYTGEKEVNHLFIDSIFRGTGYYEYDSQDNFASLDGNNFKVYKELGSYDIDGRNTLKHGQFFPFNDIEPGVFTAVNKQNLYSAATGKELPNTDPRKGEQLYLVKNVDCYFGMELEASFVQTPSGLDAWGHDIIFEFSGDDDFWLYVDDELVIDLGGIHSAVPGTVNFRTGQVNVNGQWTTLKDVFFNNYAAREGEAAAQQYVDELFQQNSDGQWVFKDNTSHTMRIFYMERGAGASNLHMRFNLASIKPGTVQLSKELSGVDDSESTFAQFPYQILYKTEGSDEEHYMTNLVPNDPVENEDKVFYKDTINPVEYYKDGFKIDGKEYKHVFLLKPRETVEINFPEKTTSYRIVECGVDTSVYDHVKVNGEELQGTDVSGHEGRKDYGITEATTKDRPRVVYNNHVDPEALRTLTITKKLYDETGEGELKNDSARFKFRLYFGTEFQQNFSSSPTPANMITYHLKNEAGEYCRWDVGQQDFVSLGAGKTDYTALTKEEKEAASFTTSMFGAIDKIPAYYTIEVREVLAGTQYIVEERDYEIPDGYSMQKYVHYVHGRNAGGVDSQTRVGGRIVAKEDPHVDVCNLKGWGLRVNKTWTDAQFMKDREPTYFAIYIDDGASGLRLLQDTIRQLKWTEQPKDQTVYWYFQTLESGKSLSQYKICEVALKDPVVDENGVVTGYSAIRRLKDGDALVMQGEQKGTSGTDEFTYTVNYEEGTISTDSNVRVDAVTNSRPGIRLVKKDWSGNALAGAEFTLWNDEGEVGTFTSDAAGLITIAFLGEDKEYTLTETKSPLGRQGTEASPAQRYRGLSAPLTLRVKDGRVTVGSAGSVDQSSYYSLVQAADTSDNMACLTVKNRPYVFRVVKRDASTGQTIGGTHFALYKEVTTGAITGRDTNPMRGYEDLVSDADGTIPKLNNNLAPRSYYLVEKSAADGYQKLTGDIKFTVTETGKIRIDTNPDGCVKLTETDVDSDPVGTQISTIYVDNEPDIVPVTLKKVSVSNTDAGQTEQALAGAGFRIYNRETGGQRAVDAEGNAIGDLTSGQDGVFYTGYLDPGVYWLEETEVPDGYNSPLGRFRLEVFSNDALDANKEKKPPTITARWNSNDPSQKEGTVTWDAANNTYVVTVRNTSGTELPATGGMGTALFYLLGALLVTGGAAGLWIRRKRYN